MENSISKTNNNYKNTNIKKNTILFLAIATAAVCCDKIQPEPTARDPLPPKDGSIPACSHNITGS